MICAGIDIGSISTKAAILRNNELLGTKVIFTGYNAPDAGRDAFLKLLAQLNLTHHDVYRIVSTGYGRHSISFAHKTVTEISCHAAGAHFFNQNVRFVIDIGGQDSKVISLDPNGKVKGFLMNDKCAAGTGRFLEVIARALELDLDSFAALSLQAKAPAKISSTCTVFAESEVVSLVSRGETRENIIAGINDAIASRVCAMVNRLGATPPVVMAGGVAKNIGILRALEKNAISYDSCP